MVHGEDVRIIRMLQPAFGRYLPLLNASWALTFALGLVVLRDGRWRTSTRWAEFGLELFNAAILLAIVAGPPAFEDHAVVKLVLKMFLAIAVIRAARSCIAFSTRRAWEPWRGAAEK